ncbi:hypothetical protein CMUS01_16671, partial [Colletotrichum musicola]
MSWLFQGLQGGTRNRRSSFSTIEDFGDLDGQKKCRGCKQIRGLLEFRKRHGILPPRPVVFHDSYAAVDRCARVCVICRVFRQALLLEGATADHAALLQGAPGSVCARLVADGDGFAVRIQISQDGEKNNDDGQNRLPVAIVRCEPSKGAESPTKLAEDPVDDAIYRQVRAWLRECEQGHIDCGNLAYSDRRPTRLLRILSVSEVQLVDSEKLQAGHKTTRYAALSYCWGTGTMSVDEDETVERGKTLGANLESRYQPFDIAGLPGTVRDAIKITRRLNDPHGGLELQHLWVDSLCIIQDDAQDKEVEIRRMQEVYGNAAVTICATTTAKATQPLLLPRLAWSSQHQVRPCRIGASWLTVNPTPPAILRSRSPLALRAWTLQEEHLSPRLLFWGGQQLSWACGRGEYVEEASTAVSATSSPLSNVTVRKFLVECRTARYDELWLAWNSIVESYTVRSLSNAGDRFNALAGLATRYLTAMSGDNEYLAGLWRATFPQDTLWRVSRAARPDDERSGTASAPSWSWASLPIGSEVRTWQDFQMPSEMELLGDGASPKVEPSVAVAQGAGVGRVRVRGRLRMLWGTKSQLRQWDEVCVRVDGVNKFRFGANPGQDVHAVDCSTGSLVAYEARKLEVEAELDYTKLAEDVKQGR